MKNSFTYRHILQTLLCFCLFIGSANMEISAQDKKDKKDKSSLISVTLRVKSADGILYGNAKVWDATTLPVVDTNYRTDKKSGEVTLKVHPQSTLIVGEYMIWDEKTNENVPIDEYFGSQGSDYYTKIKVNGRTSIDVTIAQVMTEKADVTAETELVDVHGEMRGNTMVLSTKMLVHADLVRKNNRFIWQPVIINQNTKDVQYGKAFVLDGKEYGITQMRNYDNKVENGDFLYEKGLVKVSHDSLKICKVKRFRRPVGKKAEIEYAKSHGYFKVQNTDTIYYKVAKGDTIAFANRTDSIETYYYEFTTKDKIYVDQPLTPFAYVIETLSEDYEKILISDSVDVHIYGVLHPLRLLDVKLQYAELDSALYKQWWPKPKKGPMETEGSVDFKFLVGRSSLDSKDPHNANELAKAEKTVRSIISARGTTVTGLRVSGKSSPEGVYDENFRLAQGRLNTALRILKGFIPSDKRVDRLSEDLAPSVATWQEVADSMRKDSLFDEVAQIEKIIAAHSTGNVKHDINNQGRQISRLGCYGLIKEKYLPKFRRVDFILETYVNRSANIHEIRDMYANGETMDEYSFHQLYANETDTMLRYKYCKEAFEKYPESIIFRTDHAGHLIAQNRPDTALLSQYTYLKRFKIEGVGSFKVPEETRINQVISYVKMQNFDRAGKIAETYLSGGGRSEFAKRLAQAYCGSLYKEDGTVNDTIIDAISRSSVMNEIIIRMAIGGNAEADQRKRAEELCDTLLKENKMNAMANFLKAICLKRADGKESRNRATIHLYRALEADPQLIELAKTDKDLYDRLYDEEMPVPILRPRESWEDELEKHKTGL